MGSVVFHTIEIQHEPMDNDFKIVCSCHQKIDPQPTRNLAKLHAHLHLASALVS